MHTLTVVVVERTGLFSCTTTTPPTQLQQHRGAVPPLQHSLLPPLWGHLQPFVILNPSTHQVSKTCVVVVAFVRGSLLSPTTCMYVRFHINPIVLRGMVYSSSISIASTAI